MKLGIVGATGAVGQEMIRCLDDLGIKIDELRLGTSHRSAGKTMNTPYGYINTVEVTDAFFDGLDYALFSAGGDISKQFIPIATSQGVRVIDNSSAFRYHDDIPLVVPQVNAADIGDAMLVANPNCTTAIAAVALYPIYQKYGLKKIIMSTYQAASGAGAKGMHELLDNTKRYLDNTDPVVENFKYNLAFNLIPHIDAFQENDYTKEEMKVTWETWKIFHDPKIKISCTAVRIPTLRAHSESIVLETEKVVDVEDIREILRQSPGVMLRDDVAQGIYPMPANATGKYDVEVGRIRKSLVFGDNGVELFVSGDQLLRGAALNAVEILQYMIKN